LAANGVANDYPWYTLVEGPDLLRGDLLNICPFFVPPDDFQMPSSGELAETKVGVQIYDVVMMSQSCDLEQEKLDLVLLCPHWSLEQIAAENDFFKSSTGKETLRQREKRLFDVEICQVITY
jgi:hypothetical protein